MRRIFIIITSILLIIVFTDGFTKVSGKSKGFKEGEFSIANKEQRIGKGGNMLQPSGYDLIASSPSKGVFVYGKKVDLRPYYDKVLVKTETAQKEFNWKATKMNPELVVADITGRGEEDIVIVFVTAYGTGFYQSEIHVLNKKLTREIPVDSPVFAAQSLINSRIEGQEIIFKAGGKEYRVRPKVGPLGLQEAYKDLQYGSIVMYNVENNRLKSRVTVQINPNSFLGEFTLVYTYKNGRLSPEVTDFRSFK